MATIGERKVKDQLKIYWTSSLGPLTDQNEQNQTSENV